MVTDQEVRSSKGLLTFFIIAIALTLLRLVLPYIVLDPQSALFVSRFLSIFFLGLPILAIFRAADFDWTWKKAAIILGAGVCAHLGIVLILRNVKLEGIGLVSVLLATGNLGLMVWTLGLGALLALIVKDRNMILPMSAILAGLDCFYVFTPSGPVQTIITKAPKEFRDVTYKIPTVGSVEPLAFVGPADFIFLAMFFIAIYRFKMRTRETLLWVLPVLLVYLLTVLLFGGAKIGPISLGMLPMLVPIGLTILIVNWHEFKMTASERLMTLVVCIIAIGLALAGIYLAKLDADKRPRLPAGSSTLEIDQEAPKSRMTLPPSQQR